MLIESFNKNKPFLDYLQEKPPLILLDMLLDCENNNCKNVSSNFFSNYYNSIRILRRFNLIKCQYGGICTLTEIGENILKEYIKERELPIITKDKYKYIENSDFLKN
jgi:hypothetical protein